MAAALVASPLALVVPAQAAPGASPHSVRIDGFASVEPGGGWSEGTLTVKNDADQAATAEHLVVYIGSQQLGVDQVVAEYADGESGAWQPVKLVAQDLGGGTGGHEGTAADLTGAAVEVQPHAARTFKLRLKLVQSAQPGPVTDLDLEAFLTPAFGRDGQAGEWVSRTGKTVKVTGLSTTIEGLPKPVPADGKPHAFKVSIKSANGFDWHLRAPSFFLWAGQEVGSMEGPAACDARVEVQDSRDGSWHKVPLGAVGMVGGSVDTTKWASGPVGNRSLDVRITLGKNFKVNTQDSKLAFGYYPGAGPVLLWTEQALSTTPVDGAPACVDTDAASPAATGTPSKAATPAATTPAATPAAATPSATKAAVTPAAVTPTAAKPSPAKAAGPELADTGSSDPVVPAAVAATLLAVGGAALVLTRRARRRSS